MTADEEDCADEADDGQIVESSEGVEESDLNDEIMDDEDFIMQVSS